MTLRRLLATPLLLALLGSSGCTSLSRMSQVMLDHSVPIGAPQDHPTEVAFSINASPALNGNADSLEAPTEQESALPANPYAVSLTAQDPHALIEKVGTLFEYLQAQYPALPATVPGENDDPARARSPHEDSTPGSYEDPTVALSLAEPVPVQPPPIATPIAIKILQLRDDSLLRNSVYQLLDQDPAKALRSTYIRDDDYVLSPGQFKFVPFEPIHADTRFIAVIADYRNQDDATWGQVLRIAPRGRQVVLSVLLNDSQLVLKEED